MARPNFNNRTIWTGDNLEILRGINSECVDLIYLDPPFDFNQEARADAAFRNTWTPGDVDAAWVGRAADDHPVLVSIIRTASLTHGRGMASYLTIVAVRLVELQRVLKPAGAIYLHASPSSSHYLKVLMDAIFGAGNFRNEVAWRHAVGQPNPRYFRRAHDVLLFYGGEGAVWHPQPMSGISGAAPRGFSGQDDRGPWRSTPLLAQGRSAHESGQPWRGIDPGRVGRQGSHWRTPIQGAMNDFIVSNELIPGLARRLPPRAGTPGRPGRGGPGPLAPGGRAAQPETLPGGRHQAGR